jgi:hypothetical protein
MVKQIWIVLILLLEMTIFLFEVFRASVNQKNKQLRIANSLSDVDFIDLNKGFKTNISWFRISMFVAYVVLVFSLFDFRKNNLVEEFIVYLSVGALIYVIALLNIKVFTFYNDYFVINSPFDFLFKQKTIEYSSLEDFRLYRALYNSYILSLQIKGSKPLKIEFSASSIPSNSLIIRIILNSKTGLKKDFIHRKWKTQ